MICLRGPMFPGPGGVPAFELDRMIVTIDYADDIVDPEQRQIYRIGFHHGRRHVFDTSMRSGAGGGKLLDGLSSLLSFLVHAAYAPKSSERLFPPWVTRWAAENKEELEVLSCELDDIRPDPPWIEET